MYKYSSIPIRMTCQFIEQIHILMQTQQIKCNEHIFGKSNYMWLSSRRTRTAWMSIRDEFLIRQALTKVTAEQQVSVMKQLLTWLDQNPNIDCYKIPEYCVSLLNDTANANLLNELTFSRMTSFRNSLKRFSFRRNQLPTKNLAVPALLSSDVRRSVSFNDTPTIYPIKN